MRPRRSRRHRAIRAHTIRHRRARESRNRIPGRDHIREFRAAGGGGGGARRGPRRRPRRRPGLESPGVRGPQPQRRRVSGRVHEQHRPGPHAELRRGPGGVRQLRGFRGAPSPRPAHRAGLAAVRGARETPRRVLRRVVRGRRDVSAAGPGRVPARRGHRRGGGGARAGEKRECFRKNVSASAGDGGGFAAAGPGAARETRGVRDPRERLGHAHRRVRPRVGRGEARALGRRRGR